MTLPCLRFHAIAAWLLCFFCLASNLARGQYRIPVVVHIIRNNPAAITDAEIIAGIDNLNQAFAHAGPYATGPGANTGIAFCLARRDPEGGNSTGITRTQSPLGNPDLDVEEKRLKELISWDNQRYLNIWLVESLEGERYAQFSCGTWTRTKPEGNATFSAGIDPQDGILAVGFGPDMVRLAGTYLGLRLIFTRGNCQNLNCDADGDGVCDTPPMSVEGGSCTDPQNSCYSDTSSGFQVDHPDLNANFMSYSACTNMFTEGQATKMRQNLLTARNGLLANNACDPPCGDNILVSFTRDNWGPVPGSTVTFAGQSAGAANYEWQVDGTVTGTNNPVMTYTFPNAGRYRVTLRAFNADRNCFASYTHYVVVNCGLLAGFSPDKRTIASYAPYFMDTIRFTNHSANASAYEWLMSTPSGRQDSLVGTTRDLAFAYPLPGNYSLRMVAIQGGCRDTSDAFVHYVQNSMMDGVPYIYDVQCSPDNTIRFLLQVCNGSYDTIPRGLPVSFYDANPAVAGANRLDSVFLLPEPILGSCCSNRYPMVLHAKDPDRHEIWAVFNDIGVSVPVILPNSGTEELEVRNNTNMVNYAPDPVVIIPSDTAVIRGTPVTLRIASDVPNPASVTWTFSGVNPVTCTACLEPTVTVNRNDSARARMLNRFSCPVSGMASVGILPPDYTVSVRRTDCYSNSTTLVFFRICTGNNHEVLNKGIPVRFYDRDPTRGGAAELGTGFLTPAEVQNTCSEYSAIVPTPASGEIWAAVNDTGGTVFPAYIFAETNYANNASRAPVTAFRVSLLPGDTAVQFGGRLQLQAGYSGGQLGSFNWEPAQNLSCLQCLDPVATIPGSTRIVFTAKNEHACTASDTTLVSVYAEGGVRIPNAFTPNGDGLNDIFYIMGSRDIEILKDFAIYDRFGQRIFQLRDVPPNDPAYGWRGDNRGMRAPTGAYVYAVRIRFRDGHEQVYKGTVTVIR